MVDFFSGNALPSGPDVVQPVLARGTCVHIVGVFQSAIPNADANNLGTTLTAAPF